MDIMPYFRRNVKWMLYELYGLIIFYCDIILSNMGNVAKELISFLVNNPFITAVQSNLQDFMWILLPVVIAGGFAYYLVLMKLDEVPKVYKGLWYFLVAIVCMNPLVGWLQDMTIEATNVAPQLAGQEEKENGLMNLANNMFVENAEWEDCIKQSDGLVYADKSGWDSRGQGFDHSRSDDGKWAVGVHVLNINFFKWDWFWETPDGIINSLKKPNGTTYPLIPPNDNGRPVIIGANEKLSSQDRVVATRYIHTGCAVKGTTSTSGVANGLYWYDATKYVFKWDLVPPLYGIAYALILLVGTVMALFKLFDLTIEMFVCIMFLPVTALSNIVQGGWGEMFSNNVKELFKTCGAIFLQIFMVSFAIGLYQELVTEVMSNDGFVQQLISTQWYSWTAGWIKLFFTTALILVMFWFMLNGSDALTKFMGVDTGIGSSAAAGFMLGKLGSMAGKGISKAMGGLTNAGKGMAKGMANKAGDMAFGKKDENGNRKRGMTAHRQRSAFSESSDKNGQIQSDWDNMDAKKKEGKMAEAGQAFDSMSKQDRAKMFAEMGCTSKSGDYKFSELSSDNKKELGKRYHANRSAGGKVSKGKNVINGAAKHMNGNAITNVGSYNGATINGGSKANVNEKGNTNRQQATKNNSKNNGWNVEK